MIPGSQTVRYRLNGLNKVHERLLRLFAAYWLPMALLLVSVFALFQWVSLYPMVEGAPVKFQVMQPLGGQLTPSAARTQLEPAPLTDRWDTRLQEAPVWVMIKLPAWTPEPQRILEFPSRHAVNMQCWNASDLSDLGDTSRAHHNGQFEIARAGFALTLTSQAVDVLCKAEFQGPARMTARQWSPTVYSEAVHEFHRNSGLLDGGLLVLAAFILIAGLINRNPQYLVLACWLVINLRMAAISSGWDYHWVGHIVPAQWLTHSRALTVALYYTVTFVLFRSLFEHQLRQLRLTHWVRTVQWTCLPLLVLALALPYAHFLPVIWVLSGLGALAVILLLTQILLKTRSSVALWYAASISIALFASMYEVLSAALGIKGLIGTINNTTAALTSSLFAAVAVAEQMRQEHLRRLELQKELQHTYAVIPIGLFTLDKQGRFLSANPALKDMLSTDVLKPSHNGWENHFARGTWQALIGLAEQGHPIEMELSLAQAEREAKRFLIKATLSGNKIEGSLQDVTEKARATAHLEFLASHDPLTKVLNRRGIENALATGLNALDQGQALAVAYLDLDRFKLINDLYSHTTGDEVLQQVCTRIQSQLAANMHLGRIGGDEFLIVMRSVPFTQAQSLCRDIIAVLATEPYQAGERAFQVRASIGLLEVSPGISMKDIVSTADRACREAKSGLLNGLKVYDKASRVFSEHEAELQLVERLASHQEIQGLFLEMQPIMSLRTPYASLNFEVLLRMQDAQGNRVPTPLLIHAGENAGRMGMIDRWVLSQTLQWLDQHAERMSQNQFVCMNLSGASLNDERFMNDAFDMLERAGAVAQRLCLEITESVALNDSGNTRRFIDRVRAFGAKVALDDFGAGYTSFSYLKDLPADLLKIDGSFIVNMNQHPANIAIVEAIVSLAQNLGMKTIAEWAEDFDTVETLAEIGVDYVQGFIVSRPQAPELMARARSGADFIKDESLLHYLSTLSSTEEAGHVDLVLGADKAPDA